MRIGLAALAIATGLGLAGCHDGYGYGGLDVGYSDNAYAGYPAYYGWYGDYYYPGSGYYVFDRYRRPFRWSDDQRRYWEARRPNRPGWRDDWRGFAQNGYRYQPGQGRPTAPGHRDRGYGVRAPAPSVPGDAYPPAYRAGRGGAATPGQGGGWHGRGGQPGQGGGRPGGWHGHQR